MANGRRRTTPRCSRSSSWRQPPDKVARELGDRGAGRCTRRRVVSMPGRHRRAECFRSLVRRFSVQGEGGEAPRRWRQPGAHDSSACSCGIGARAGSQRVDSRRAVGKVPERCGQKGASRFVRERGADAIAPDAWPRTRRRLLGRRRASARRGVASLGSWAADRGLGKGRGEGATALGARPWTRKWSLFQGLAAATGLLRRRDGEGG